MSTSYLFIIAAIAVAYLIFMFVLRGKIVKHTEALWMVVPQRRP